ncbi:MAG: hypothetical protein ACYCZQ_05765 [Burkholderiales bacterium]
MRRLPLPALNSNTWITLGMVAGLAMASLDVHAAWHDEHPGAELQVHFVHLTGYAGDNAVNRRNLLDEHKACVDLNRSLGRPARPLPPDGIPANAHPEDVEIYYSPNRTLTVTKGTLYKINFDTCALTAFPHHRLELHSAIGRCDIDLIQREARGVCDDRAHARAPNTTLAHLAPTEVPPVDLDKVPPAMRAQVAAQLERLKNLPQGPKNLYGAALVATGAYKDIAGYRCESYRADALKSERCIAHPHSPFPIPAASFNAGIPGLLLDMENTGWTLRAQEVRMNIWVSKDLFVVPAGLKMKSIASPGVHP